MADNLICHLFPMLEFFYGSFGFQRFCILIGKDDFPATEFAEEAVYAVLYFQTGTTLRTGCRDKLCLSLVFNSCLSFKQIVAFGSFCCVGTLVNLVFFLLALLLPHH